MKLNGLKDSLRVKIASALDNIKVKTTYTMYNNEHRVVKSCDVVSVNGNEMLKVTIDRLENDKICTYDVAIKFDGDRYLLIDEMHSCDIDAVRAMNYFHDFDVTKCRVFTSGRTVVDYVVNNVCYFMGLPTV
jgi:hypothetical protein